MTDYYTPQQNGISGLEEFGAEFVTDEVLRERSVFVGDVKLVGPSSSPEAVAEFVRTMYVIPTVRLVRVYCSPTAPPTVASRADLRRGWRYEAVVGLPDSMRGPDAVAEGALAFVPGWDRSRAPRIESSNVSTDGVGGHYPAGAKPWLSEPGFTGRSSAYSRED